MNPELNFTDPDLEQAVSEIRNESVDDAVIEAAAARVWARLAHESGAHAEHIPDCASFQALIPDLRAGRLPEARATLLRDHLHQCVACRRVYEGRGASVVAMPLPAARRHSQTFRLAAAAAVVAAAGVSIWLAVGRNGSISGHAIVRTLNGALYEVSADGLKPLTAGQDLPDNIEIRTAKDSSAFLRLRDGSVVELRERSGFRTSAGGSDLTVQLTRGSVIVEAAKRRTGHLYVATADCRVAVTGTIFGVSAGAKGSRVSVIQGEVHVDENNQDHVLHPGNQIVTSPDLAPDTVREDIAWSRNRDKYNELLRQLSDLQNDLKQIRMPDLRYGSQLLAHLPASTVFFASIPNLAQYLGQAQTVFQQKLANSPELARWWAQNGARTAPVIDKLRAASEYLGDEIAVIGMSGSDGPVFLSEMKRPGFPEFLKQQGLPAFHEEHGSLMAFGPSERAVHDLASGLDSPTAGIQGTPFYPRIVEAYRHGAGFLVCADLSRVAPAEKLDDANYLMADEKQNGDHMEARLSLGFNGIRTGIASWLADPAPLGSLDYVSPDASIAASFAFNVPGGLLDQISEHLFKQEASDLSDARKNLAAALGGEFSLSLDGAAMPVPSWKLVAEVYNPAVAQAALQQAFEQYSAAAVKSGKAPIVTSQETFEGRTYYSAAVQNAGPIMEAHYTFADGYLIAAPTRALVARALQIRAGGDSILHSSRIQSLIPRDHYANFSAVVYQNLGPAIAPLAGLLGGLMPQTGFGAGHGHGLPDFANMKPSLIAAYAEPDRITFAANADLFGPTLTKLMTGDLAAMAGSLIPFGGTREAQPSYR